MKAYPKGFQGTLWWIFALVSLTGLVLIPSMLEMRLNWNVAIALPSGSRVWAAALHTLAAFATFLVLGALLPLHIRHGWRRRLNFWSGVTLVTFACTLPLTALGIDYLGDDLDGGGRRILLVDDNPAIHQDFRSGNSDHHPAE